MSSTRYRTEGTPPPDERYCSSKAYQRGLSGSAVSMRCEVLPPADRELVCFLHKQSWDKDGGLAAVARELIAAAGDMLGTEKMHELGVAPGRMYDLEESRAVRHSIDGRRARVYDHTDFPLKGDPLSVSGGDYIDALTQSVPRASGAESYAAGDFMEWCRDQAEIHLQPHLEELCLNPEFGFDRHELRYFCRLREALRVYMGRVAGQGDAGFVETEIAAQISDALDFALQERCCVLLEGHGCMGERYAARKWCEAHPGTVRLVQVPASNDDLSFMRAVAKALGVAKSCTYKPSQIRAKVEAVLERGHLMVVFHDAEYLWPQKARISRGHPQRITWLMTAVLNHRVPCALVTTKQFTNSQRECERLTAWSAETFIGQIAVFRRLPVTMRREDLVEISRRLLPGADEIALNLLAEYGRASGRYVPGIEAAVKRTRFEAGPSPTAKDIAATIERTLVPSDGALMAALDKALPGRQARAKKTTKRPVAPAMQSACKPAAADVHSGRAEAVAALI